MPIIKEYLSNWSSQGKITPIKISNPTTENFSVKYKEGSGIPETTIEIEAGGYTVLPYAIACYVAIEFGKKISYGKNKKFGLQRKFWEEEAEAVCEDLENVIQSQKVKTAQEQQNENIAKMNQDYKETEVVTEPEVVAEPVINAEPVLTHAKIDAMDYNQLLVACKEEGFQGSNPKKVDAIDFLKQSNPEVS
jgi:hypothetical protein